VDSNGGVGNESVSPATGSRQDTSFRELNGDFGPGRAAKSKNRTAQGVAPKPVTPIGKWLRMRDRDDLRFVSSQPCLVSARSPSDVSTT